jgi:O-antigen/teichoic acid export membrane protein
MSSKKPSIASDTAALASGGAINVIGGVTNGLLSFVFTIMIARALHASGAGAFYIAVAVFSILALVSELGASSAIVRTISNQRALGQAEDVRPTILIAALPGFALACVLGGLMFALAPNLSRLLGSQGDTDTISEYLRIFALVLPLATAANILLGATRGFGRMRPSAVIDTIIKPISRVGLALLLLQISHDALPVSLTWVIPVALTFVLALAAVRKLLREHNGRGEGLSQTGGRAHSRKLAFEFWRFALPQSLSGVLMIAVVWIDVILLGVFQSPEKAGVYATLSRYLLVGELALSAIALAIGPIMSRLLAGDGQGAERHRAQSLFRFGTAWVAAVASPLYLVMAVFAPVLMQIFGASFLDGTDALAILSLAMLANVTAGPVVMVLLMGGRSDLILVDSAAAFAANMILNVLLIPPLGMVGAAIAWTTSVIGMNALAIAQVRHVWQIHPFGRPLALITCSAVLSYGALGIALSHSLGRTLPALAITCVLGSVIHGIVVWQLHGELGSSLLLASWRERRGTVSLRGA